MSDDQSTDLAYGPALAELEGILEELETSAVDVDHLAERVARAAHLIAHCRDRLRTVEADVGEVVEHLASSQSDDAAEASA